MKRHFSTSQNLTDRLQIFHRVAQGILSLKEAALILDLSYRQSLRLFKRFQSEGQQGLIHRAKGASSNRAFDPEIKRAIIDLYKQDYPDFGPTFAVEKLASRGYDLNHETLRGWLIDEGLWEPHRSSVLHRSSRLRRPHFGELVQMDGSFHLWFEDRAPSCCLMNMVDDATGATLALLAEEETTEAAMILLWKWIESFGLPLAIYADGKNVYFPKEETARKASLEGREQFTHFGRACSKLAIEMIRARSPQAKGRVERKNGVYQDRLVKEMRLAGISDIASGNEFLYGSFLEELNDKFARDPKESVDFHRRAEELNLADVFCIEEERTISADWVVRFENDYYQLKKKSRYGPAVGKVAVRKYLNGELHFNYRGEDIEYVKLEQRPEQGEKKGEQKKAKRKYKPGPDHPWKKSWYR